MNEDNTSQLVTDYCNKYPYMPNNTLAKLIYAKHPILFLSVDSIRSRIRTRRGARGVSGVTYKNIVKNRGKKDIKEVMKYFKLDEKRSYDEIQKR